MKVGRSRAGFEIFGASGFWVCFGRPMMVCVGSSAYVEKVKF